jgi:signal transduction histidine kinase
MKRAKSSAVPRRFLVASLVFGLFVLFDIALFGWLLFRSLSQREIERVLLETRAEAEALAKQIARRAERQGKDLYTAVAVERETQTYIDQILRQREIVRTVEIRDTNGVLVFQARSETTVPIQPGGAGEIVSPPPAGTGSPELQRRVELRGSQRQEISEWASTFQVPEIRVPIGDYGQLEIGLSAGELSRRIGLLRGDLLRQTALVAVISMTLLVAAYVAVWQLLRRSQRLELQAAEAERMAYIGTLASGLAHEIRNPLNSLNLNMQMLEEEIDEHGSVPTGKRLLSITRSEISRLERLVTDFLAYAKPRPLELEEVPVARLLERVPEVLAGEIQKRGARVEVEDRSGGASVRVDRGQMTQLLLNLAQNSLAAAEEAGRRPLLRLTASRQGGSVLLEVEDNGVGIPPEEQDKVFDLFYSTKKGGTGLGLAIVDRIARAHEGQARVRSTPGEGTAVTVEIPAAAPEAPASK